MNKVFISQPMRGKTTKQIKQERKYIVDKLTSLGYEVINSVLFEEEHNSIYMLGKSIMLLSDADYILFMDKWQKSRGCRIERSIAEDYDITILDESKLMDTNLVDDIKFKYDL